MDRARSFLAQCSTCIIEMSHEVFAYIDPGTGTLIWQAVAAGLVAIAVFFRSKVFGVFKRKDLQPPSDGPENSKPETPPEAK